mmetsp:Transcript_35427/g.63831  ORF Transcript_35427/g.63831 Transcript_35427/m.63831 type:complete len:259 (+) Transcript_35427:83-859(+)|eukprot:CAMPEP_0201866356 /NCGR_PEP_ID=MMETSP0902-20130614/979_1 /ASSEMBLY_ACC=CAM_ASM_000551 /TAXON_ID=420261 /ORGANISM="Thalassiosira antarctica, Strain CCMP982" /LENGTH=258 /DNA_ID=CAMNT_0048391319 /DNA_START=68 /DNA_END=844 /DNA_ORIENTATION=+
MIKRTLLCGLAAAFSSLSGASAYVSTFVPKKGIVSPAPKGVTFRSSGSRRSSMRNDIKMMPIGVPKVAYRVPGGQGAEWVDIYNRLYRERIVFLGSEIDDELANQIIGVMLYLDEEDSTKPIYLYINSPGGSVLSGLAIFDAMQLIKSEVITINLGLAASMASFILSAGSKGKRLALPSSRIMIHQPMGGARGQAQDIKVEAAQIMRIRDNLVKMYSMFSGQTTDQITKDLDRDNFMSAQEALEYGLIDRVLERPSGQ